MDSILRLVALALAWQTPPAAGEPPRPVVVASPPPLLEEYFLAESLHVQRGLQVSASFSRRRSTEAKVTEVPLLVELGLARWLEVQAEAPWLRRRPAGGQPVTGLGDLEVGLMLAPFRNQDALAVSLGVKAALPTGHARVVPAGGEVELYPFLILGRALGRGEVQVGVTTGRDEDTRVRYDLATVYPLGGSFRAVLEVDGEAGSRRPTLRVVPGLVFKPGRGFEAGLAAPLSLTSAAPPSALVAKLTAAF